MEQNAFYKLTEQLSKREIEMIESGINYGPVLPSLWLDYQNNQGERKQFCVKNITSSPYPGCFEADCFSDYQFTKIEEQIGFCETEMAITSHRTFKIANIISARIY